MSDGERRAEVAIALTPAERNTIVEAFFALHPGAGEGRLGLGQAILDFQAWEVGSGRITESGGSPWWRGVNGQMVLDIAAAQKSAGDSAAVRAWREYASGLGTQAELWEAHQRSLHAALRLSGHLLANESDAERAFAEIVVDVVDRTALAGRATDSPELAEMTRRYYPWAYPVDPASLAPLESIRERTANRLLAPGGAVFTDVGIASTRWS